MKKILLTTMIAGALALSTFAQGYMTFSAGSTQKISYSTATDGSGAVGFPAGTVASLAGYGNLNVALYTALSGTTLGVISGSTKFGGAPDLSSWAIASPILQKIAPTAGLVPTSNWTTDTSSGSPGASMQFEIVGWTGTYTSFGAAYSAALSGSQVLLGWCGSTLSTGAFGWQQISGTLATPLPITKDATHYNGLELAPYIVPEPSTMALAGLGIASLLIFRRRK